MNWHWFNFKPFGKYKIGSHWFVPFEVFNRHSTDGHFWGFNVLQYGCRSLFCITHYSFSLFYLGWATRVNPWYMGLVNWLRGN